MDLVTLATMRKHVRKLADIENELARPPEQEITENLNIGIKRLYDKLRDAFADKYTVTSEIALPYGTNAVALPNAFLSLVGVDAVYAGKEYAIEGITFGERMRHTEPWSIRPPVYMLKSASVQLFPSCTVYSGATIRLHYIPTITPLSLETDSFDGVNGWTDYAVAYAARMCLMKDELDCSQCDVIMNTVLADIESERAKRDIGRPLKIFDSVGRRDWEQ